MLDRKEKILLGGVKQRIHYRTNNEENPVLLFLHGGPGVCNRHSIFADHSDLLDTFTMVTWDQRGTGGSYFGVPDSTLTVDQLTKDARDLVAWLCRRFHKEKIFVIGGSWGSELGTMLCANYPEQVAAFVGFGQVVDGAKNEAISYQFAYDSAKAAGDTESLKILEEVGPPVKGVYKGGFKGMMAQRNVMMKYGGYSQNEKKRSYWDAMVKPILLSGEYSLTDLIGYIFGYKRVLSIMWPEVGATNFPETVKKLDVPFFIFDGKLDMNTPAELVEDWFNMLEAPRKELIWFEDSGHNPMGDEPEKFKTLLRQRLLDVAAKEEAKV